MIRIEEIAREQGLDPEDVAELLADFLDYSESHDLESIRENLGGRNLPAVRNAAHSIKGAALNLKLQDTAHIALRLEAACDSGSVEEAEGLAADLAANLSEIRRATQTT